MGVSKPENYRASVIFSRSAELLGKVSEIKDIIKKTQKENEFNGQLYFDEEHIDTIE